LTYKCAEARLGPPLKRLGGFGKALFLLKNPGFKGIFTGKTERCLKNGIFSKNFAEFGQVGTVHAYI
jgi:hypothetical protein